MRVEKSYCRLCPGLCGTQVTIDEADRVVEVHGDREHPMTMGYACIKGLQAPHVHHGPSRLLHPQKRLPDGSFERIPLEQALDEIAEKLRAILAADEPRSVAAYRGTQCYFNSAAHALQPAFLAALGSPSFYSSATIDQSAKFVSAERLGAWEAGWQPLESCDVWVAFGYNPLVSVQAMMGFPALNPNKRLQALKARDVKLIVVDPRRSETANHADIHLQPYPGEDATIAAGMLHLVLGEGWHDAAFCAQHANGLEALRAAVASFTPDYVAARAGLEVADLRGATELFAHQSRRGFVTSCTAPSMGPHSNLAVHLLDALNVVCGRFKREGEPVPNPGVLSPRRPQRAQVVSPRRAWTSGPRSRVGDYHGFWGEMMSNTLPGEILTPGPGRVRALIVDGGNPLSALPDEGKAMEAFRQLELLVTIDPVMSATARLSHYVLPPKVLYEREDLTAAYETAIYPQPFAQHAPALVPPPAGAEVVDDGLVYWALARRLGLTLQLGGQPLDMRSQPTMRELLQQVVAGSAVDVREVFDRAGGRLFSLEPQTVGPADAGAGRFELAPDDVLAEIDSLRREPVEHGAYVEGGSVFTHRLAVRRVREAVNSALRDAPAVRKRMPCNAAQLHPDDLAALGLADGERALIRSSHGELTARVEADASLKRGVVTLAHGWGGLPEDGDDEGANVNRLISADQWIEPINAMARMTGVPVNVTSLREARRSRW